ncbi:retrotransposable element Tf2 [Tanacetum coccineum]
MDFIDSLPNSQGKIGIFVVVDRLSKYAHLISITHPYTAKTTAQLFLDHIYILHSLPTSIVIDKDKVFMSLFWKSLFKSLQVQLKMIGLPLDEYWYNTNYHSATKITPFEIVYDQAPSLHIPYVAKDKRVELVERTLQATKDDISMLKFNLKKAQDRMKSQVDKHRSDSNGIEEDATLEDLVDIVKRFPSFVLDP